MKEKKHRKYESPTVSKTLLEAEGLFCQSVMISGQVDENQNVNETGGEPSYLEF